MVERRSRAAALACLLLLAGCATSGAKPEAELRELLAWLPGSWSDAAAPEGASQPIRVVIVPAYSLVLGHHAFYLEERAADDPRRLLSQRLLTFKLSDHGEIAETDRLLSDPPRWRDAAQSPELFTSLQEPDLRPASPCPLLWRRDGDHFTALGATRDCAKGGRAPGAAIARAELRRNEYAFARRTASGGEEPLRRLSRESAPP
jgi:hypothetical protein